MLSVGSLAAELSSGLLLLGTLDVPFAVLELFAVLDVPFAALDVPPAVLVLPAELNVLLVLDVRALVGVDVSLLLHPARLNTAAADRTAAIVFFIFIIFTPV